MKHSHSKLQRLYHRALYIQIVIAAWTALSCWPTPRPATVDPAEFAVAAYGDSLTLGGGSGPGGWPVGLPAGWLRFNGGKNAERAREGAARPIAAPDLSTLAGTWDVVVMMWGTNDVTYPGYTDELSEPDAGWPSDATIGDEEVIGPIEGAAMTLQAAGLRVVVASPPPLLTNAALSGIANARLMRLRDIGRARLGSHGVSYVDLFSAFSASSSIPDPSIYYQDGTHWNALGNQRAGELIAETILEGCPAGFEGSNCATNIDECVAAPCENGGACTDGVASYTCACPADFTGATCETNVDECASAPCENGGVCTDGVASYTCECAAGYTGATCETNIDECAAAPCENGGACTDGVASYTCACPAGFTGATCEMNVDECAAAPCENGGACSDGVASYTCACPEGFTGSNCETPLSPDP